MFRKRLRLFLTHTSPITSSDEASRLRYIMAQSAGSDPLHTRPTEAPTPTSTNTTTVHRHPITSHAVEDPLDIFLPINPALTTLGLMATSIPNTPTTATPDSSVPQDNTSAVTDDEDNTWLAMAMTFNDLYQGLTENNVPSFGETDDTDAPTDNDDGIVATGHIFANNDQADETENPLTTPFHHGFHRMIEIDQVGGKTISYIAPDGITRLTSGEEAERFLHQNPTLGASISQFCWSDLTTGFENPAWETVHGQNHRQRHSWTRSKPPTASSSQMAAEDHTLSLANVGFKYFCLMSLFLKLLKPLLLSCTGVHRELKLIS